MKRLLIIGASVLQLPAIRRAKEMGFHVGVADYDPHAVGIPFADEYFNVSTVDIEGIAALAENFRPDGIFTLATDMPMRSIAAACERCGLPGISTDTAVRATDKAEMIRAFDRHGVPHPWYYVVGRAVDVRSVAEEVTYPCISKPTDNSGSRGVMLIHSREELERAWEYSSGNGRSGAVIVEEYLTGHEVSVEIVVLRGTVHVLQVTDKLTTGAPHFVEMGHSQPSQLPAADVAAIRDVASRAVKAVGINDGPAHVEIMLTADGPKMIELGARMGGDCITTHLVPLSTGVDMIGASIRIACGEEPDLTLGESRGSAIRYFDLPYGRITAIDGEEEARQMPGVRELVLQRRVGDTVSPVCSSTDRVGFVITQADTAQQAVRLAEDAAARVRFTVEAENEAE